LNLHIDPASSVPLYAQVVEQIRTLVASRALRPGDRLPTVRDLAVALRVNRNTAARAYQILEMEGVIDTRRGEGSFIASAPPVWSRQERYRRLERAIDRALVEAFHLDIPTVEIPRILQGRIGRLASTHGIEREVAAVTEEGMEEGAGKGVEHEEC